jgi:hypothetical protein
MLVIAGTVVAAQSGSKIEDPDTRQTLRLPSDERHLVLTEMRNFVIAMQQIMDGLASEDMATVAVAARKMGSGAANEIPPHVVAKLPDPFKQLAGKVHTTFDAIALDAESLGDTKHTVGQLRDLTQHCVACHAIYQVDRERTTTASK